MSTYEKWLQPDSWHRVVDGQLGRAELRELVSACEQHPNLWKCCAVAFLEEQTLRLELGELADQWPATRTGAIAGQHTDCEQPDRPRAHSACAVRPAALEREGGNEMAEHAEPLGASRANGLNYLGFAASLALAFLIGWQTAGRFSGGGQSRRTDEAIPKGANEIAVVGNSPSSARHNPDVSVAESTNDRVASQPAEASRASDSADSMLVGMTPSAAMATDAIEQALEQPEQFVPLDRRIPKQLVELEQRGLLHIESIEGFVPVRLRDGNTAVVPVQQIDLRPVRKAY